MNIEYLRRKIRESDFSIVGLARKAKLTKQTIERIKKMQKEKIKWESELKRRGGARFQEKHKEITKKETLGSAKNEKEKGVKNGKKKNNLK